jgi:5-methylcytosine-specific restriction endonuclease McrA
MTEIDHHVPLAKGGTNAVTNLRLMHATCNRAKADSLP